MEQRFALPVSPVSPRTPTTDRNVSLQRLQHPLELCAQIKLLATVLIATVALRLVQRVLDRRRTTVFSVLLAHTSSTGIALALMEMAFAPVLV